MRLLAQVHLTPLAAASEETALIGGQAVMEGVMMRSPSSYCVAVRLPSGEIATDLHPVKKLSTRYPFMKWPILRGLFTLGSAMVLGTKALRFSARCALGSDAKPSLEEKSTLLPLVASLLFTIVLYKVVPLYLATLVAKHVATLSSNLAINLVDGMLRIGIFLSFMYVLSRTKDMYRLFQYHGAEHKVVFNFESGQPLTVENAQRFSTYHPRCGTSFLVVVLLLSLAIYAFLPFSHFWSKLAARLVLLPFVIGLSYEAIRFAAKGRNGLLLVLTRPGLWLQRVTTKPPTDDQTEVAIYALERALQLEKEQGGVLAIA